MRNSWILPVLAAVVAVCPVGAQAPVTMPAGSYVVEARDTSKHDVGMVGWPFVLKGNGSFTFTTPDSLLFSGKLTQKDGLVTFTDQSCGDPGLYYLRQERGGYVLDLKSEACAGRDSGLLILLFRPGKPKK